AVDDFALVVHQYYPVAITVKGNTQVGAQFLDPLLECLGLGGTAAAIDVGAVGVGGQGDNLGPQLAEHAGSYVVGGAVGAVHDDLQAVKAEAPGHGALAKFNVASGGILNPTRLAQALGGDHGYFQVILDLLFYVVGQLGAVAAEKLDAVVHVTVVGGTDHNARLGLEG